MNSDNQVQLIKAVIYGADANAISVANALKTESPARFKLVGFIDKININGSSKRILNLPILNHNKAINLILNDLNANAIIITEKDL